MNRIFIQESVVKGNINDNFWKWFGSSKIIKNGKPLVVYKGMLKRDWRTGDMIKIINSTTGKWAGYFTDDKTVAQSFKDIYSTMGEADVYEVYLSIKNPFIVDAAGKPAKDFMLDADVIEKQSNEELKSILNNNKYDAIIVKNTFDEGTLYIPFHPNQIKSIHNDGTWDINDSDIYS